MPRNSDFPDYKGLKVEHSGGWSALDYHNQSLHPEARKDLKREPPSEMKGVTRRPGPFTTPKPSKRQPTQDQQLTDAAIKDWRNRGLSDNTIIDN